MKTVLASNESSYGTSEQIHERIYEFVMGEINPNAPDVDMAALREKAVDLAKSDQPGLLRRVGSEAVKIVPDSERFVLVYRYRHWTSYQDLRSPDHKVDIYWEGVHFDKMFPLYKAWGDHPIDAAPTNRPALG